MTLILIFKLLLVVFFLIMFLRRPSLPWGVGLLTVSTAVLLNTMLGVFDEAALRAELGFLYYVIMGILFAGGAFWLLGLLRPYFDKGKSGAGDTATTTNEPIATFSPITDNAGHVYDMQMIYEDMQQRFDQEDMRDLIFDLNLESHFVKAEAADDLAYETMVYAQEHHQAGQLALAVERILSPPAPDMLPRLEKITSDSPRPILRYYLLAHVDLAWLAETAVTLGVNWDTAADASQRTKTRELLLSLYKRNEIDALLNVMREAESTAEIPS